MACVDCKHWQLRSAQKMARQGFAPCAHLDPYRFISSEFMFTRHVPLAPDLVVAREDWLAGRTRKMRDEAPAGEEVGEQVEVSE